MADWYFEENGAPRGPVAEADLNAMLVNRLIRPDASVWTASFGPNWKPALQTQLEAVATLNRPPPLPAATSPLQAGHQTHVEFRPERVPATDDYAKWLAFTPLLGLAIDFILFADGKDIGNGPSYLAVSILFFLANSIFATLDSRNVYHSWRNPKLKPLGPFIFLTPIAYFWRRARITGSSFDYLWIWLACAAAYLMGAVMMMPDA